MNKYSYEENKDKFKWKYNLKSNRLKWYNYSSEWAYFITICCKDMEEYFGKIVDWKMLLNEMWKIVEKYYLEISEHFKYIVINEYIIMPNHIHFVVFIENNDINQDILNKDEWNKWGFAKDKNCMLQNWLWKMINWYKWRCSFEINNKLNFDWRFTW